MFACTSQNGISILRTKTRSFIGAIAMPCKIRSCTSWCNSSSFACFWKLRIWASNHPLHWYNLTLRRFWDFHLDNKGFELWAFTQLSKGGFHFFILKLPQVQLEIVESNAQIPHYTPPWHLNSHTHAHNNARILQYPQPIAIQSYPQMKWLHAYSRRAPKFKLDQRSNNTHIMCIAYCKSGEIVASWEFLELLTTSRDAFVAIIGVRWDLQGLNA